MKDIQKHIIGEDATIHDALVRLNAISNLISLTLFVVNGRNQMVGTITDGDIRRKLVDGLPLDAPVSDAMHREFCFLKKNDVDVRQLRHFRARNITLIPLLDSDNRIVDIYDLKKQQSVLPIDAVLMAGGKGERLRPLTEKTPKPLLKVGDKTIIDHNIDRLISYGVEHISVTVNYLKEQIETHFAEPRLGVKVRCYQEPKYLGTLGSIKFVEHFYNDTVLIMNSDVYSNINFEEFFLHFKENDADMSIAAIPYTVSVPYGILDLEGKNVKGIMEKPSYNYYASTGIYLVKKELIKLIPENEFYNATDFIELLVSKNKKVVRFPLSGTWIDIGSVQDYSRANELAKHNEAEQDTY